MSVSEVIQQRQALIILGMHRSGTSALSGTLARLGAAAPRTLIPANPNNPKGFWESTELMKFHDRLLAAAGSQWNDWDGFDADRVDPSILERADQELPALLHREFGDAGLMLIKDPRMCRMFPVWKRTLKALDVCPKVIVPFRSPEEVARSLMARNSFSRPRAQLIWLRHVLDAELFSRDMPRVFLGYAELLRDWRASVARIADALGINWPRHGGKVDTEIDAYLSPSLRHHKADTHVIEAVTELDSWVMDTHAALMQLVDAPADAGIQSSLDSIRNAFERSSVIYAEVIRDERAEWGRQRDIAKQQLATLKKSAKASKDEAAAREREQAEQAERLAAVVEELKVEAGRQQDAFRDERDGMRAQLDQLSRRAAEYGRQADFLRIETDARAEAAARYLASLEQIRQSRSWRAAQWLRRIARLPEPGMGEDRLEVATMRGRDLTRAAGAVRGMEPVEVEIWDQALVTDTGWRALRDGKSTHARDPRLSGFPGLLNEEHHRLYGRPWCIGRSYFDFLLASQLAPHHRVLDFGCGAGRLGIWLIDYLDAGCYVGMDHHLAAIDAFARYEVPLHGLADKAPRLILDGSLDIDRTGARFELILDCFVSFHLSPESRARLYQGFARALTDGGRVFLPHEPTLDATQLAAMGLELVHQQVVELPLLVGHVPRNKARDHWHVIQKTGGATG